MGTQATAARRPAATGSLQLSIMSIHSLIIEQISERDIFEFVLLSRSVYGFDTKQKDLEQLATIT